MCKKSKELRKDFPILSQKINGYPLIYFDNAATAQKPQCVIDALVSFYTTVNANVYRGIHSFAEQATELFDTARATVAQFIGALPEEIIFTSGTTEGINFIASTWGQQYIQEGDEIVITELEHHANLLPWQQLALKKGAVLKCIPVNCDGTLDMSTIDTIITHRTKLVAVVHVSNAVGTHNDVATIAQKAHAVGARILVDAAQSVAHQFIDVKRLHCDFLVFSGHKLMGPTGIGVLFIKKDLHEQIEPYQYGGGMVENATFLHATWRKAPHKFEAGTPAIAQAIGLATAVDYIHTNIDFNELATHEAQLCSRLIDGLSLYPTITILGPLSQLKQNGHMVSFFIKDIHSHDVAAFLNSRGIAVRAGHHCAQPFAARLGYDASVRVSFYCYNTQEEVDYLLSVIAELM